MATLCPHCGFDLESIKPFTVGKLFVDAAGAFVWWGKSIVPLTAAERLIVVALARADGVPIKREVLAEISGYEGDHPENIVAVQVSRANKRFREVDPDFNRIENVHGAGLRWKVEE